MWLGMDAPQPSQGQLFCQADAKNAAQANMPRLAPGGMWPGEQSSNSRQSHLEEGLGGGSRCLRPSQSLLLPLIGSKGSPGSFGQERVSLIPTWGSCQAPNLGCSAHGATALRVKELDPVATLKQLFSKVKPLETFQSTQR